MVNIDQHISVSQLTTWLRCPKQYEFRYMLGFKLPPKGALARGSACHKAWETDHKHKMETKQNLPISDILDVYSTKFEEIALGAEFDDDKGAVKDQGAAMTKIYHERVSLHVQPVAVENEFEIEIGGHIVKGIIDLETDKGEVRDAKTAGKKKSNIPMDHQLQMAVYSRARPDAKAFMLDTAIVNSKSDLETLTLTRTDLPQQRLDSFLNVFGESLIKGFFPPTQPDNWACSEKWCGYWHQCKYGAGNT